MIGKLEMAPSSTRGGLHAPLFHSLQSRRWEPRAGGKMKLLRSLALKRWLTLLGWRSCSCAGDSQARIGFAKAKFGALPKVPAPFDRHDWYGRTGGGHGFGGGLDGALPRPDFGWCLVNLSGWTEALLSPLRDSRGRAIWAPCRARRCNKNDVAMSRQDRVCLEHSNMRHSCKPQTSTTRSRVPQ